MGNKTTPKKNWSPTFKYCPICGKTNLDYAMRTKPKDNPKSFMCLNKKCNFIGEISQIMTLINFK